MEVLNKITLNYMYLRFIRNWSYHGGAFRPIAILQVVYGILEKYSGALQMIHRGSLAQLGSDSCRYPSFL